MSELFVPYEIALQLKQKGFNESCFGGYGNDGEYKATRVDFQSDIEGFCLAPIHQQVVNWLKETHEIYIYEVPYPYEKRTMYHITFKDETGAWSDGIVNEKNINNAIEEALTTIK